MSIDEAKKMNIFAKDFSRAANISSIGISYSQYSPATFYLYCHSIELSLKSFLLLQNNQTLNSIKKLKHNLVEILDYLILDINLSEREKDILRMANNYYNDKGFEYYHPQKSDGDYTLLYDMWDINDLKTISEKLLEFFKVTSRDL